MQLSLGCRNPYDDENPHLLQQKMLELDFNKKLKIYHFVCGRGSGKTVGSILALLQFGLKSVVKILYLSPTQKKLRDNFLSVWLEIVPKEIYTLNKGELNITLINGTSIYLRSRSIDNKVRGLNATRGLSVNFVWDDEAAEGFDLRQFTTTQACVRSPGSRGIITISTPSLGSYAELVNQTGKMFNFASDVNPFLPEDFIDNLKSTMSAQEFKREVLADFVSLSGRVWESFSLETFPKGNMTELGFTPGQPFIISMDIGSANSSYLIWQEVGNLHIVVGEYHPTRSEDGSVKRILEKIKVDFGTPARIIAGNDMNTRAAGDNLEPIYFARQVFGAVPVSVPYGHQRSKLTQYDRAQAMILNGAGIRTLLISKKIKSYDPDKRGIVKTFENDSFPEGTKNSKDFLPKGPNVIYEHCRDALMYYIITYGSPGHFVQTNFLNQ